MMIWQYDMVTGDGIDVEEIRQTNENAPVPVPLPAQRLMSVQEEAAKPGGRSISPAVVMLPVESLLAQ
jgi:hypothetical protein